MILLVQYRRAGNDIGSQTYRYYIHYSSDYRLTGEI